MLKTDWLKRRRTPRVLGWPEAEAASRMLVEMRDASTALQYFVSWSHWGWLQTAEKHLGLLEDLRSLDRIGLHMQWSQEPSAGRLEYDTASTQKLFSFLKAMLKYRGGSNLWHTWGPGAVAGLLSTEETQVRSSLLWHRNLFDAVAEVRRTGSLAAQGLLKDSMVKDAFFGHVFHLLRIEDWKEVSETAQNFRTNVFSGLLNTKLVEDANKFQREQEDRGNNSKSVPMTEAWQTVSKHEVLKAYKRPEVQASAQYLVPAKWNIEQVCRTNVRRTDAKTPEQEADFEFLRRVTGNQTWPAFIDVESCKVATVTPTPPMIGLRSQRAGIQVVAGAWEPLLKNVLGRGCAGLSESQLKKLNGLLGNDEPEANQPDQEIALAVRILINQDPTLSEQEVLNRIHIKTADEELPVEGMTEEMAQVLRDTIRPEDQQKIMKTLSEKNKPPPVKVAERQEVLPAKLQEDTC